MTFNETSIAEKIRADVEGLIATVSGQTGQGVSADEIEGQLWWSMLDLGQQLLQLFFTSQAEQEVPEAAIEVGDAVYGYVGRRERQYQSIYGKISIKRRAYWQAGQGSVYPLDAALNLPERQYSYRVQSWVAELSAKWAYETVQEHLAQWFRLALPKKSLQAILHDPAQYHARYVQQQDAPLIASEDSLLVVQADGKGIPMTAQYRPPPHQRRQAGAKTATKEATVTALYTTTPYHRSPEQVIHALLRDAPEPSAPPQRPPLHHKRVAAMLSTQTAAIEQLQQTVSHYASPTLTHRVAVCDGDHGLQNRLKRCLPDFTRVLDIFHVMGYLWDAADALFDGRDYPRQREGMHDALSCLFHDQLDQLLTHLEHHHAHLPHKRASPLRTTLRDLTNQREHMHYQTHLAQGFPIGSGVIEGTCCHLIHDRFEQSGMRWSRRGAQAMLNIRATLLNQDWHDVQAFYRLQEHQKRYPFADPPRPSAHTFSAVAA
jgi:hypothetical protein